MVVSTFESYFNRNLRIFIWNQQNVCCANFEMWKISSSTFLLRKTICIKPAWDYWILNILSSCRCAKLLPVNHENFIRKYFTWNENLFKVPSCSSILWIWNDFRLHAWKENFCVLSAHGIFSPFSAATLHFERRVSNVLEMNSVKKKTLNVSVSSFHIQLMKRPE